MHYTVSKARYEEIVAGFSGRTVLVLGDLMMDEYVRGAVRRISPESPVMVLEVETEEFKPGGAANVVNNLLALGARVEVAGVVGDDEAGERLRGELKSRGAGVDGVLTDSSRPTTRKTRIVAQNQQVLRVDREQTHPVANDTARRLLDRVLSGVKLVDAVLVSDYRKGVLTPEVARGACDHAKAASRPLVANPKPSSARWLSGATVLSLNQIEAEELGRSRIPDDDEGLRSFGDRLVRELDVDTLVVTRSSKGLAYWRRDGDYRRVPGHPVEVFDVAGAGDTTISAMTLALVSGADRHEAAFIANHAGACVVRKAGVATVSRNELVGDWEP